MRAKVNVTRIPNIVRAVQQGIHWLKDYADGLTDSRDIAITISALVAAEKNPHSYLVQHLVSALKRRQAANGSWSDELWDTVWASKALYEVGHGIDDVPLEAAFRFLQASQDPLTGNWYEEPFETMLVLDLIARTAPERIVTFCERPLQWVASLQKADGCVVGIRYTGMAASLFCLTQKTGFASNSMVATLAVQYLRRDLNEKPIWTTAAWSNYYPLQALLDLGGSLEDPLVAKAVDWFIASQDSDGKWMQVSRVHDTAMSVLILSSLLVTPLVDLSEPRTGILSANRED